MADVAATFHGQAVEGHFERFIEIPTLPGFRKSSAYVLKAVNSKFKDLDTYLHCSFHEHVLAFITSDKDDADRIHNFAASTLQSMREPQLWTFQLRVTGVGALNRAQIKLVLAEFGDATIKLPVGSLSQDYCDSPTLSETGAGTCPTAPSSAIASSVRFSPRCDNPE